MSKNKKKKKKLSLVTGWITVSLEETQDLLSECYGPHYNEEH